MGRGYSSFHRKQGPDQSRCEQAARGARLDPKRTERAEQARAERKAERERRNELLKNFEKKDKVTDGRYIGRVKDLDSIRGELVVCIAPTGKEVRWAPSFVNKIP